MKFPLSSSQKAVYIFNQLSPTSTAYNIPLVLKIRQSLKLSILEESINELVNYYPQLQACIKTMIMKWWMLLHLSNWRINEMILNDKHGLTSLLIKIASTIRSSSRTAH